MPDEKRFTGVSTNFSTPEKSMIASSLRSISFFVIPRMMPLRYTFSRPVSSAWNPVPTSSKLATRPLSLIRPAVGSVIRLRIFRNVVCKTRGLKEPLESAHHNVAEGDVAATLLQMTEAVAFADAFDLDDPVRHGTLNSQMETINRSEEHTSELQSLT